MLSWAMEPVSDCTMRIAPWFEPSSDMEAVALDCSRPIMMFLNPVWFLARISCSSAGMRLRLTSCVTSSGSAGLACFGLLLMLEVWRAHAWRWKSWLTCTLQQWCGFSLDLHSHRKQFLHMRIVMAVFRDSMLEVVVLCWSEASQQDHRVQHLALMKFSSYHGTTTGCFGDTSEILKLGSREMDTWQNTGCV